MTEAKDAEYREDVVSDALLPLKCEIMLSVISIVLLPLTNLLYLYLLFENDYFSTDSNSEYVCGSSNQSRRNRATEWTNKHFANPSLACQPLVTVLSHVRVGSGTDIRYSFTMPNWLRLRSLTKCVVTHTCVEMLTNANWNQKSSRWNTSHKRISEESQMSHESHGVSQKSIRSTRSKSQSSHRCIKNA